MADHPSHNIADIATTALANKPWIGVASTTGSGALGLMNVLTPYLEFSTLVFGFCIGLITLIGVIRKHLLSLKS
jgi:hypothetical protein